MLKENTFTIKKLRVLVICQLLGWFVCTAGEMADSIIAGLFLDSEAVSAVGIITPIYTSIYFLSVVVSVGTAIMYSQELGAMHVEKSRKIAGMGLIVSIIIGATAALLLVVLKQSILDFYGCSETITAYASEYYNAFVPIALIYPPMWLIYTLVTYDGDASLVLLSDLSIAGVNAILSLVLVQRLGISGMAIGTLASVAAGLLAVLPHFMKKSNSIRFKPYFSWKDLIKSIKLSSTQSLNYLYVTLIDIIFNKFIIMQFSDAYLPAYTVVNSVINFQGVLMCTISAGAVFISVAYGENNPKAIKRVVIILCKYGSVISAFSTAAFLAIAPFLPDLYGIADPEVASSSVFAGVAIGLASAFAFIALNLSGYYPVIDKALEGNVLVIAYAFIGPVVLGIPLGLTLGFNAMAVGFALSSVFALLLLVIVLACRKQLKKAPLLLEDTDEIEAVYDLTLDKESILSLRNIAGEFLSEQDVADGLINKVQVIIEDTLIYIMNRNSRDVLCECTLLVSDEAVRLITKDNGVVFDIMAEAEDARGLECYIMAMMMEDTDENRNTTTITFNRNTYIWKRAEICTK